MTPAQGPGKPSAFVRRLDPLQSQGPWDARLGANYRDAFGVAVHDTAPSAEEWMRKALEGAPGPLRWFVQFGWRCILGFRPAASRSILGWQIVEATDDAVLLEQRSRLFRAALVLYKTTECLTWQTWVRFESRPARHIWTIVAVLHRRIVPYILSRAVSETPHA